MVKDIARGAFLLLVSVLSSCAGTQLISRPADPGRVQGMFDLYLYGCHFPDDTENAAFLLAKNARYPFELYTLASSYTREQDVAADDALARANNFLRCGMHTVWYTKLKEIPDGANGILGYEMVPVYVPYDVGIDDVLLITYRLRDGKVQAVLRPNPNRNRNSWDHEDDHQGRD